MIQRANSSFFKDVCNELTIFFYKATYHIRFLSFHPLIIRKNTDDLAVFRHVFIRKELDFQHRVRPMLIIDGGAYVGYSSLWFANKFPKAKIIAVEPEEANYESLRKNTCHYPNIQPMNSAVWNKQACLKVKDTGLGEAMFMVEECSPKDQDCFKATTIQEILEESGFSTIDVLKLDIQGAEKEVFSNNYKGWLGKVNLIIIELHDRFKEGCTDSLYRATRKHDFSMSQKGEKIFLVRTSWLADSKTHSGRNSRPCDKSHEI
jgi:FkbM family methyltransferase